MLAYRPVEPLDAVGHRRADRGRRLPIRTARRSRCTELAELLAAGGAEVELVRQATGHGLVQADLDALAAWLAAAGGRIVSATEPIAAATRMGAVHLTVADLARSLEYYRESIGLDVLARRATAARRSAPGRRACSSSSRCRARSPRPGRTGLFHFALLLPDRRSLARWVAHAVRERVRLAGASDHFVSEAIYLSDPDRHGIEIYADRPRALWEGQVAERMGTDPLDLDGLLGELGDPADGAVRAASRSARPWATSTCRSRRSRPASSSTATCSASA